MIFRGLFQKKYCFYVFISGKNVFLPIIINEENIKRIMKELVEKIAALVADGRTKILDSHCIDVSYPGFYDAFEHLL